MTTSELQGIEKFGWYQLYLCVVIGIPVLLHAGSTLSYVFTAGIMSYRCLITECEDATNTTLFPSWLANAVPYSNGDPETCARYVVQNLSETCSETTFSDVMQNCDEWVYDPEDQTILSEWDITCTNNQHLLTLVGTINNIGQFVGLIYAGYLSDRFGRRTVLVLTMVSSGIIGLIRSFSVNYWMFITLEFLDMSVNIGCFSAAFVLGLELVGTKWRVLATTIIFAMYSVGEIILALLAMWLSSWRTLLRAIYIPYFAVVLLPFLVPESLRWLIVRGKDKEADKVIRKLARMNGVKVSDDTIRDFKALHSESIEKEAVKDETTKKSPARQVISSRIMLTRFAICSFCWVTNAFVYYGLALNSVYIPGDKYISFILVSAIAIPAFFIAYLVIDRLGRKSTLSGALLLSGAFCLAFAFIPSDSTTLLLALFMGGKFFITVSFTAVYVITAEMFPTPLRHSLLGGCSMIGRIGSILAPQTPLLANVLESLPMILFGSIAIIAGLLSLTFPETVGKRLPVTVYEAERIGKTMDNEIPHHSSSKNHNSES